MVGIELRNYATVHKMSNQHKPGWPRMAPLCVMVGIELRNYATVHKMSNQHKPGWPWGKLVATYNFAASPLLHYMISTPISTLLAVVAIPKLRFLRSCLLL